jgi:hypothetical protein
MPHRLERDDTVLPRLRLADFAAAMRSLEVPEERWTDKMRAARKRWAKRLGRVVEKMRERTRAMQQGTALAVPDCPMTSASRKRTVYRERRKAGRCVRCACEGVAPNAVCAACLEVQQSRRARLESARTAAGLCPRCGERNDAGRACTACLMVARTKRAR